MKTHLLLFFLFFTFSLSANVTMLPEVKSHDFIIHTWGGGPLLSKVFDAISLLLYGDGSFKSLLTIALIIGGFASCILALHKGSMEVLLSNWLFPALLASAVILAPRGKIIIKDHLIASSPTSEQACVWQVDNVPLVMKFFCTTVSTMSFYFTRGLERVTHGVDDATYNWTGHIYAGDHFFSTGHVQINSPMLEKNIHNFVYDCVFNDISLGKPVYNKQDLWNAADIMSFLVPRTTIWLSTRQFDPAGESKPMRCNKAAKHIQEDLKKLELGKGSAHSDLKNRIFGQISSDAGSLLNLRNTSLENHKKLLQQSFLIDATEKTLNPNAYAAKKAQETLHRTQGILGGIGAQSLAPLKNFFEALIYLAFPIVLVLSICSLGFRSLISWGQFFIWMSLWPPFFVIVNFLLNTTWDFRVRHLFGTKSVDLTLFSSSGLADLYHSMEGITAAAFFSIPFLAYALVKGGVSSMIHLASTLNAPAQGAAAQSAQEQVNANYSIGNLSYGNQTISSRNMMKWDDTPSLTQGSMTHTQGTFSMKMAGGETVLRKEQGSFGADISMGEVYGKNLSDQYQSSTSHLESVSSQVNEAFQTSATAGENYLDALSEDKAFSHLESQSEQDMASTLYSKTEQQIQDFAKNYGVSKSQAINAAARLNAGLDIKGFGIGGSFHADSSRRNEVGTQVADRDSELRAMHHNLQELRQYTEQDTQTGSVSSAKKASQDYAEQLSHSESLTQQYHQAQTEQETWSSMQNAYESSDVTSRQLLNNEFSSYLVDKYRDRGKISDILSHSNELKQEIQAFTTSKQKELFQERLEQRGQASSAQRPQNIGSAASLDGSSIQSMVEEKMAKQPNIQEKREDLEIPVNKQTNKNYFENKIEGKKKIELKEQELEQTKISKQRKDQIKDQAENETVIEQSEHLAKEVGGGLINLSKKVGKVFTNEKK